MTDKKTYTLDDVVISRLAQMLQEALLLGYDIVDNMRTLRVVEGDDGKLTLDPTYVEAVKKEHELLQKRAEELQAEASKAQATVVSE